MNEMKTTVDFAGVPVGDAVTLLTGGVGLIAGLFLLWIAILALFMPWMVLRIWAHQARSSGLRDGRSKETKKRLK